jgi:hypothetical protein
MYQGDEKKFAIELTAPGFNIDTDDFDLEVKSPKVSLKASKEASTEQLIIFYETVTPAEGDPYKQWYAIVDTTTLSTGEITVIATAHVTDSHASGGVRRESAVAVLGTLKMK